MDLDDQLRRYFSTTDIATLSPATIEAGLERMGVDLGMEGDRSRRFAIWIMMHMLGSAPDLEAVFEHADDRRAARDFMDLAEQTADTGY